MIYDKSDMDDIHDHEYLPWLEDNFTEEEIEAGKAPDFDEWWSYAGEREAEIRCS